MKYARLRASGMCAFLRVPGSFLNFQNNTMSESFFEKSPDNEVFESFQWLHEMHYWNFGGQFIGTLLNLFII